MSGKVFLKVYFGVEWMGFLVHLEAFVSLSSPSCLRISKLARVV